MNVDEELEKTIASLEPMARAGDLEAAYDASVFYHSLAMAHYSKTKFDKAEELLNISFAGGYEPAVKRMAEWDTLKYAFEKRCQRNAKT